MQLVSFIASLSVLGIVLCSVVFLNLKSMFRLTSLVYVFTLKLIEMLNLKGGCSCDYVEGLN